MLLAAAIQNSSLVSQQQWKKRIAALKRESDELGFFRSRAAAKKDIYKAVVEAVEKRAGGRKFGVLLSGGVDSSFIAFLLRQRGHEFTCFSVGMKGSRDLAAAKHAARKLKLGLVFREYAIAAAEKIIKETVRILNSDDPVMVGIAATEMAALRLAAVNKTRFLFTGLGSEEIFAGYQRHVVARDIHAECWRGLAAMWQRDFLRDFAVAAKFKAAVLTPFLDKSVVVAAMRARPEWKIRSNEKKLILREIAAAAGLPEDIAFRPKLAAQYGSGFDRAMGKLARSAGFSNKRDYLQQML